MRLFFSVHCLGLIHELLKIACPYQPLDLILESRTLVHGMPYVFVKGSVSFNVPSEPLPLLSFRWPVEISVHYNIDVV